MKTVLIKVTGKVQGVFFRQSAVEIANSKGITGTVRNLEDGNVEIIATGEPTAIDELLTWCRTGSPNAVVATVQSEEQPLQTFKSFTIIK